MRLRSNTGETETAGLEDSTSFSIKVNGKAFKILLDGLYSDKIGAIIRELGTNAYDAHLAVGKGDEPFLVKLPTYFDPTFRVRDYGVSMTHEQAKRLLATVFESSKDNSNNQVGAFGLGSKSPFSLVESYTITVWKDGEKRMYLAHYNSDGVPDLALMGREPSTEPTGVEFALTVNPKDTQAFADRAQRIYRFFPTFPKIEGNSVKLVAPEYSMSGAGWHLFRHERPGALARQGCVVYPLNASSIPNITPEQTALLSANVLIDFPIGSLDVAASRESLSYEPQTCANILARLNTVVKEVSDKFGKAISDAPTLWEAAEKRDLVEASNLPNSLVRVVQATKWQGKTVPTYIYIRQLIEDLKKDSVNVTVHGWDSYRIRRYPSTLSIGIESEAWASRMDIWYGRSNYQFYFTVKGSEPTQEGKRIRTDISSMGGSVTALLFVLENESDKDKVLAAIGNPPKMKWTKDLPAPVVTPRTGVKRGTTKKEQVKVREIILDTDPKAPVGTYIEGPEKVVDLSGDAYYLLTKDNKVQGVGPYRGEEAAPIGEFLDLFGLCVKDGHIDRKVPTYFVSVVYQKRVEAFQDWKLLIPVIKTKALDGLEDRLYDEALKSNMHRFMQGNGWTKFLKDTRAKTLAKSLGTGALFDLDSFIENSGVLTWNVKTNRYGIPETLEHQKLAQLRWLGVDSYSLQQKIQAKLEKDKLVTQFQQLTNACNSQYPMITAYKPSISGSRAITDALEYIEALDLLRASKAAAASAKKTTPAVPTTSALKSGVFHPTTLKPMPVATVGMGV